MIPTYLYHYTTLDTLKLIMINQTIRFTRIDLMNDPVEGYLNNFPDTKKYVFSSSWTAEKRDEVPLWKMYSNLQGVRIRMPIDLFNSSESMKIRKLPGNNYLIQSKLTEEYTIETQHLDKNFVNIISNINTVFGPTTIEYCENEIDLDKGIVNLKELNGKSKYPKEFFEIYLNLIGQRKIDFWKFEKEFRYRIFFGNSIMVAGTKQVLNSNYEKYPVLSKYLDVRFKKESLENIEILLAPNTESRIENELKTILNSLGIENYTINKSKIRIK